MKFNAVLFKKDHAPVQRGTDPMERQPNQYCLELLGAGRIRAVALEINGQGLCSAVDVLNLN